MLRWLLKHYKIIFTNVSCLVISWWPSHCRHLTFEIQIPSPSEGDAQIAGADLCSAGWAHLRSLLQLSWWNPKSNNFIGIQVMLQACILSSLSKLGSSGPKWFYVLWIRLLFLWGLNELFLQQLFFCPLPDFPSLFLNAKQVHSVSCALHTPEFLVLCHFMCLHLHMCRLECLGVIYRLCEV